MNQQSGKDVSVCPFHSGMEERTGNNSRRIGVLEVAVEKIKNRLPVWATLAISLLMLALGALGARAFGQ